jgi:hypothetical protein
MAHPHCRVVILAQLGKLKTLTRWVPAISSLDMSESLVSSIKRGLKKCTE